LARELRVLVVDDEPVMGKALRPALERQGFEVATAMSGAEGLAQVRSFGPNVILLDLGLPDIDGVDLAGQLRERTDVPIIVLSVRDSERDKIAALDNGANDYVTKPFSMGELLARIRAALRYYRPSLETSPQSAPEQVTVGEITLDAGRHQVTLRGNPVHLSPTEFNLLEILMRSAGKLVTHRTLLQKAWGPEYARDTQLLRVYIGQLRSKIEDQPDRPVFIVTEPGVGYRFRDVEEA
jgi:two-component system, OmpR family, KDP operon response regulator KdpE